MDFTNKTINFLILHSGLQRFSADIYNTFGSIYLLDLGISFPIIVLIHVGNCILRSILRPLSLLLSEKIGLKRALIVGVFIGSGLFLVILKINGVNSWLYFYILYLSLCDITYCLPYHSYFAVAGNKNSRGKQVGTKLGFATIFRTIAPLAGGIIITHYGFLALYLTSMVIMLLSAFPLFYAKNIEPGEKMNFKQALKAIDKQGMILKIGDGILFVHSFVWVISLFYLVGDYVTYGRLVTFELLATVLLSFLLGYLIDKGDGKNISIIGLILTAVVIILRAFVVTTVMGIIITDILMAFGTIFYISSFEVGFYNIAKESKNTLWFNFFGELGWDIGASVSLALIAGLFILGVPLQFLIVFSLPGLFLI